MNVIERVHTPQLKKLHAGKVRDSFRVDDKTRLIVVTDRISAFDLKLKTPIPGKGEVLNRLAAHWFARTRDIVQNHLLELVSENASLVREATPIRVEMIVRGYLAGSMSRGYKEGKRVFSGVRVADGLGENDRLPEPIVTPTTKEESDREITPEDIVSSGLASRETYEKMREVSLRLFARGTEVLGEKGLLLADTKYEFGLIEGEVVLIDEIHTPDSSRIWSQARWSEDHAAVPPLDKELVRAHLLAERQRTGAFPRELPPEVVAETRARYTYLFQEVTGEEPHPSADAPQRLYDSLVARGLLKPGFVALCMGSKADLDHARRIAEVIDRYGVRTFLRVVSAHKNGERIPELAASYNDTLEPGVVIAIAGESNGLGGALSANLELPVINAPPFADKIDLMLNVASSLMMPSRISASTVVKPENAAHAALRALNLRSLRARFRAEIDEMKAALLRADDELGGAP